MRAPGYSLVELLVTMTVATAIAGMATPTVFGARDAVRAASAADYVASLLYLARTEALKRHTNVAIRFEAATTGFRYQLFMDGNGDGVRTSQVQNGVDPPIRAGERLEQQFPGVSFGLDEDTGPIEAGDDLGDRDPIRVGRSRMISFSPTGTCTPGTLYLLGRGRHQLAVRVLGTTGRLRLLQFNFAVAAWQPR
ncbi:MAG TPA: GspH/FimT family pseudopilin [Vicinamibacterales bacterium]|nr:GspH/FimT family pseudopilin [Vicinamibacterales bacterium]